MQTAINRPPIVVLPPTTVTITMDIEEARTLFAFIGYNCPNAVMAFRLSSKADGDARYTDREMSIVNSQLYSTLYHALVDTDIAPSLQRTAKVQAW